MAKLYWKGESIFYYHRSKLPMKGVGGQVTWLITTIILHSWKKDMNCNGRALAVRCQGLSPTESGVSLKGHLLKVNLTLDKRFCIGCQVTTISWVDGLCTFQGCNTKYQLRPAAGRSFRPESTLRNQKIQPETKMLMIRILWYLLSNH